MSENNDKLTAIEQALAELQRADRAGTFRPTPLDTKALIDGASESEMPWIIRYRKVAVAASVLLAAGVWASMFAMQLGDVHRIKLANSKQPAGVYAAASLQQCMTGPNGTLLAACKGFDVDSNGHLDLADFSTYQRNFSQ